MTKKSKAQLETENAELRSQNKALELTVTNLLKEIDRLHELKIGALLDIDPTLPPEEQIILKQIKYFAVISLERSLTLDETRALDILLKNKRLIEDKKPKETEDEVPNGTTNADLLRIVSNGEEKTNKQAKKRSKS